MLYFFFHVYDILKKILVDFHNFHVNECHETKFKSLIRQIKVQNYANK